MAGRHLTADPLTTMRLVNDARSWSAHLGQGAASFVSADLAVAPCLSAAWAAQWSARPGAVVLMAGDESLTAEALEARSRATAHALVALGLVPGSRLVWSTNTSLDAVVGLIAAIRLGAVVVPANVAYTQRELAHIVEDVQPVLAVVESEAQMSWLPEGIVGITPTQLADAAARSSAAPGPSVALDRAQPSDPALIVYTSGTTGVPKGAVLSQANVIAGVSALILAWRWTAEDRLVLSLPLFHVHGLCAGLFGTLQAGGSAILVPRFDPDVVFDVAHRKQATLFFGVPTLYHRLVSSPRAKELAGLRLCVSGSAPLPAQLWERCRAECGVGILERYGMTETLLTVSNPIEGERRPGTVGLPLPGVSVRVRPDPTQPDGEAGALWVKGPSVFGGYWNRPQASSDCFDGEWFDTGDLAHFDDQGYLVIKGRTTDLIISGGYNVYPAEVEDVLATHPGVAEAAVRGVPSDEWGELVAAWVVPRESTVDVRDLAEHAAARLAPYKRPRVIHVVDELPRNAMGKVQRSQLI